MSKHNSRSKDFMCIKIPDWKKRISIFINTAKLRQRFLQWDKFPWYPFGSSAVESTEIVEVVCFDRKTLLFDEWNKTWEIQQNSCCQPFSFQQNCGQEPNKLLYLNFVSYHPKYTQIILTVWDLLPMTLLRLTVLCIQVNCNLDFGRDSQSYNVQARYILDLCLE